MAQPDTVDERPDDRTSAEEGTDWFASSALRLGLVLIGVVILLFALGQAVGIDFIGMFGDVLATNFGRWLAVAFFALLIIVVAMRGFASRAA
jgi:polyferredoxin